MVLVFMLLAVTPLRPEAAGPLSKEEAKKLTGPECARYTEAFKAKLKESVMNSKEGERPRPTPPARPDDITEAQWEACRVLGLRAAIQERARLIEISGKYDVKSIANNMKFTAESNGKLCASANKVPAEVPPTPDEKVTLTPDSFDVTWECAGKPDIAKTHWQYEVVVDEKKKTFTVFARGYPWADEKLRTLSLSGKLVGTTVTLDNEVKGLTKMP